MTAESEPKLLDFGIAKLLAIWIASEYMGQACTVSQFASTLTTTQERVRDGTRTALGNWYTRVSKITP